MKKLNYPNPQFIRKNWIDLNGEWDFAFDDLDIGFKTKEFLNDSFYNMKIKVPYSYHTEKSGIGINENHPIVWYRKKLKLDIKKEKRYILHFGAVDYDCDIWINEEHVTNHRGGHVPFQVDITDYIKEESTFVIRAKDFNKCKQPIGKQSWKNDNFLCWYTRTVGIWQSVWLEETGNYYITSLEMTPDIDNATLKIDTSINNKSNKNILSVEVYFDGDFIVKSMVQFNGDKAKFSLDVSSDKPNFRLHYWTPDTPNLYDIKIKIINDDEIYDEVESYFGMRKILKIDNKVYLNNQEFYQKLILDQGYIKAGGMTLSAEELESDVKKIKAMGFNGARKHQKIEDHRYMYLCDKLGLVMWAEMPSAFEYSFETNQNIITELYPFVQKHYNHPSVIVYTLLNESWGINEVYDNIKQQQFVKGISALIKSLDNTRLVVGNDGWEHVVTDILTIHDYNDNANILKICYNDLTKATSGSPSKTSLRRCYSKGYKYNGEPIMISEYGGVAYQVINNGNSNTWGYGERLSNLNDVIKQIEELTKAVMDIDGLCGFCYTQLTDVEQEVNGLLDCEHNYKFNPEVIRAIMQYKHNNGFVFK